jgi:integrase
MYPDGGDLYLQVTKKGSVSWILRYRLKPLRRSMGLGPYPLVSLEEARKRRDEARRKLTEGVDPLAHRKAQRSKQAAAMTFREAARGYIEAKIDGKDQKTVRQYRMTLLAEGPDGEKTERDYCKPIANLPVEAIDAPAVLRVLSPVWAEVPETASRLRGRIEAVIDYARVRGFGGDPSRPNPARWKGNLQHTLAGGREVKHHAAMPYADLPAFMTRLQAAEGSAPAALQLLILTALRTTEVLGARWEEIDLEAKRWTVPAGRMKPSAKGEKLEHIVPLSPGAVQLLERARRDLDDGSRFVFPGARPRQPLSNMALGMTMRRMGVDGFTVHGFRSAFRDWAADHGVEFEVAEACLAHTIGSSVTRAYLRTTMVTRRRPVMERWARYLASESIDNVVSLRG